MTPNTARSRFADTRFPWWVGVGAAFDDRQARARRATAQPGTLLRFLGGPPVPEALSGSACHAGGFFERVRCACWEKLSRVHAPHGRAHRAVAERCMSFMHAAIREKRNPLR